MNILKIPISYRTSNTDMSVWWESDSRTAVGHGAEVTVAGNPSYVVNAITEIIVDTSNIQHAVHRISLTGLTPDRSVTVRVFGPNFLATTLVSFRTPAPTGDLRIGVLSSPEGFYSQLDAVITAMQPVDFYLSCGGIVGRTPSYESLTEFYNTVLEPVGESGIVIAKSTADLDSVYAEKMLPTTVADPRYFAVSVGSARVVALDTSAAGRRGLAREQAEWAINEFNSPDWKNAKYRIVMTPDPFRVSLWDQSKSFGAGTGTDAFLFKYLYPLLQQSGADLVLAGRVHSYQRGSFPTAYPQHVGQITHYVASGGIAPAHKVAAWSWGVTDVPGYIVLSSDPHYVVISLTDAAMTVTAKDMSGNVLDEFDVLAHNLFY